MTTEPAAAAFWAGYIRNRNVDERTANDGALPVGGGYALYVAGTHFDHVLGAGWDEPLRPDDFGVVEEFYAARGVVPSFELSTLATERDADVLARAQYVVDLAGICVIYERDVPVPQAHEGERPVAVRVTRNRSAWAALGARAFANESDPDDQLPATHAVLAAAASVLMIASIDGQDVGTGAILLSGDRALFVSGGVLPEARRRGVHAALAAARLRIAYDRGAIRAAVKARQGSPAERTALRAGFTPVATTVRATRAATPSSPSP